MTRHAEIHLQPAGDQGFSLVEILIVIAVLAVLSVVTVFAVRDHQSRSDVSLGADAEETLHGFGLLRSSSTLFDVDAGGDATPAGGSSC